jgi:polysaccharide export outer membrane protein
MAQVSLSRIAEAPRCGRAATLATVLAAASLAAPVIACAQWQSGARNAGSAPAEAPEVDTVSPDSPDYVIDSGDVLRIQVWRNPELSTDVPVRPDGRISVPLLNDVQAAGLTTHELRETIATSLAEYVTAPDVTVIVAQVNSKRVYVVGEVARPAAIPLNVDMRVLDAIVVSGGFSPYADKDDVKILRRGTDGSLTEYRFDYGAFLKGKHPESNLRLQPGDTIVVSD